MAFRLQSAIAGAAKKFSERMEKFDDTYADTLKNSAANLAKEAAAIRKERMAAVRDYQNKGNILINDYGLSEAQVQSLLSGGTSRYDQFIKDVQSGAMQHVRAGNPITEFNSRDFAKTLFSSQPTEEGGTQSTFMSLDEQAQMYGQLTVPSSIDMAGETASIVAGTQRGIFKMDPQTVRAALGDVATGAEVYEGPGFTPTGISYTSPALSAEQQLGFETSAAKLADIEAQTDLREQQGKLITNQITNANEATKLAKNVDQRAAAAEERLAALHPAALRAAQLNLNKLSLDNTTQRLQIEAIQDSLAVFDKFGMEEAELANALVRARIKDFGTFETAKALAYASKSNADAARTVLTDMQNNPDDFSAEDIANQQKKVETLVDIALENAKLMGNEDNENIFSKVNLDTSFDRRVKNAAQSLDLGFTYTSFTDAISKLDKGQRPGFFNAVDLALQEMRTEYSAFDAGRAFIAAKVTTFNAALNAYANDTTFSAPGPNTYGKSPIDFTPSIPLERPKKPRPDASADAVDEFKRQVNVFEETLMNIAKGGTDKIVASAGDIIKIKTPSGRLQTYVWSPEGKWLGY
tara:strand:+ start:455 stop:2194 length:1740 start_codon:yes stop_codon:yes gene_type:complete